MGRERGRSDGPVRGASTAGTRGAARVRASFRTPVRGHAWAAPPVDVVPLGPMVDVELHREPGNPSDPWAIAVWALPPVGGAWRIGYLDRAVAARLAPRLDAGERVAVTVEGWLPEPAGRWSRPLLRLTVAPSVGSGPEGPADRSEPSPDERREAVGRREAAPSGAQLADRPPGVRRRTLAPPRDRSAA